MSDIAIRVENLGKRFRLGHPQTKHDTLRDALASGVRGFVRSLGLHMGDRGNGKYADEMIWVLQDVSFEVRQGEVVGIIGSNGAGKSTLLKILSSITEPTTGCVAIYGRVGSLLEVGTGFHSELTGRENIYLSGAILGMKRAEIDKNFEAIVDFAEVEKFIDTPVKRYSSGMYLRLAFAVAAHLEPEILLVDEVLAVGDAAFQKKCLGKMGDVAREGRTVLFVSHNLAMVQTLCSRGIFLRQGTMQADDTAFNAVTIYLRSLEGTASQNLLKRTERRGQGQAQLARIEISASDDYSSMVLATGRPAYFIFHVATIRPGISCSFTIYDQFGQPVTYFDSAISSAEDITNPENKTKFICKIDELLLIPGRYRLNAAIVWHREMQDHIEAAAFFEVEQGNLQGRPVPKDTGYGSVVMPHQWVKPVNVG